MDNEQTVCHSEQTASIMLDSLSVMVQGGVVLRHETSLFLNVVYKVHDAIKGKSFEEPDVAEYIEVLRVRTSYPVALSSRDASGITLELRAHANVADILTELQLNEIRMNIKKQARGTVTQSFRPVFVTSDNLRLPEDDAIKTRLGMDMLREYKR